LFFVDVAWRIHWRRSRLRGTHARESGFVITGWVDVDGICAKSVCDHGMIGYGGFGSGTGIYDGANGAVFFFCFAEGWMCERWTQYEPVFTAEVEKKRNGGTLPPGNDWTRVIA